MGVVEQWVIIWFPPAGDRVKAFRSEAAAVRFAHEDEVADWHPLMEHRITTTNEVSELVPIPPRVEEE